MTESSLESLKPYRKSNCYETLRYSTSELIRSNPPIYVIIQDYSYAHMELPKYKDKVTCKYFFYRGTTLLIQKLSKIGGIWFYSYDLAVKYERYINDNNLGRHGKFKSIPYYFEHIEFFVPMAY